MTIWYLHIEGLDGYFLEIYGQNKICSKAKSAPTYPLEFRSFILIGAVACHHFQSVASLAKVLPDAVEINVESFADGLLVPCIRLVSLRETETYKVECCDSLFPILSGPLPIIIWRWRIFTDHQAPSDNTPCYMIGLLLGGGSEEGRDSFACNS